ncbi:MAG: acetyl-CoA carboxylase biotin carboxyl carrier protein [Phycisphaerae bacterium]|nr:acetyl-CoA carboxylase biotin carboxyl carrier protein [Phycisphaerae bacterium]
MAKKTVKKKAAKKAVAKKTTKKVVKKTTKNKKAKKSAAVKKVTPKTPAGILADVEHLMQMMAVNDVTEIDIDDAGRKISLKRGSFVPVAQGAPVAAFTPVASAAPAAAAAVEEADAPDDDLIDITSPMVGTFYSAPSPDSDAFASVGDKVNTETVVSIVEAMKVMNEIKAECSGTIAEVCVKNAEPVEFGQVMFRVKP